MGVAPKIFKKYFLSQFSNFLVKIFCFIFLNCSNLLDQTVLFKNGLVRVKYSIEIFEQKIVGASPGQSLLKIYFLLGKAWTFAIIFFIYPWNCSNDRWIRRVKSASHWLWPWRSEAWLVLRPNSASICTYAYKIFVFISTYQTKKRKCQTNKTFLNKNK